MTWQKKSFLYQHKSFDKLFYKNIGPGGNPTKYLVLKSI